MFTITRMDEPKYPVSALVALEVRALMGRHRVSQKELAAYLGLSQPSVSNRLNGAVEWSVDELDKVAGRFDVPITQLFADRGIVSSGWLSDDAASLVDLAA